MLFDVWTQETGVSTQVAIFAAERRVCETSNNAPIKEKECYSYENERTNLATFYFATILRRICDL